MKIAICGGPKCGKTTLAAKLNANTGIPVRHTDDLVGKLDWSAASLVVAHWLAEPGDMIVEGTALPRSLRKFCRLYPGRKPCDFAVWLQWPKVPRTPGQETMARGCRTVWIEVLPTLQQLGVEAVELRGEWDISEVTQMLAPANDTARAV